MFMHAIADDQLQQIRDHLRQQRALGGIGFQQQIEAALGRCMETRGRGRPARVRSVRKAR
jgi:putative transposase